MPISTLCQPSLVQDLRIIASLYRTSLLWRCHTRATSDLIMWDARVHPCICNIILALISPAAGQTSSNFKRKYQRRGGRALPSYSFSLLFPSSLFPALPANSKKPLMVESDSRWIGVFSEPQRDGVLQSLSEDGDGRDGSEDSIDD